MNFVKFKQAVAAQFERMQAHPMYRSGIGKDAMWDRYQSAFPPGTNEVFRERREHDCTCCKQFVRAVGDAVAIIDGKLVTAWDVKVPGEPAYQQVADKMAAAVKAHPIADTFLHYEPSAGTDKNFEQVMGETKRWDHFFTNLKSSFVAPKSAIPTLLNETRTARDVLHRGLTDIRLDAIDTVLELIDQNGLYRGAEHKYAVNEFRKLKVLWEKPATDRTLFAWEQSKNIPGSVAGIKNTSIGTLLIDLSQGMDVDAAVRAFESKVAPANYKRTTAAVTKGQIDKAKAKIAELGLASALERRYAVLADVSVNNVLFADRSARKVMGDGIFDDLVPTKASARSSAAVETVPIEMFIKDILPKLESVEVLLENRHKPNLVSLIAPLDPTAGRLFKWDNNFSWSYNGEVADAIKERVKAAGGNVTGDVCCRLAWYNFDDLDLHMYEPDGGHVYFGSRGRRSANGGILDVDMNVGSGQTRTPVENIVYANKSTMGSGEYKLVVNQYNQRETKDLGFDVDIDILGTVHHFHQASAVKGNVEVARIKVSKSGIEVVPSMPASKASREVWNLPTETFHRASVLMLSPNYWDEKAVGNKHYFFMLDGCANDDTARGFYNEFLKAELDPHRKVFEMVGSKLKPAPSAEQLSGLGFSSTKKDTLTVRVKGSFNRTMQIVF